MASTFVDLPDNVLYQRLEVVKPLEPSSWKVVNTLGKWKNLSSPDEAAAFFEDTTCSLKASLDKVFLSISQEADGQHRFVRLADAADALCHGGKAIVSSLAEAQVKDVEVAGGVVKLFARAERVREQQVPSDGLVIPKAALGGRDEYCPKQSPWASNYDVIPDLSLSLTNRLILCDEATLARHLPEERIFDHLKLIVNCHENKVQAGKYKIGSCSSSDQPAVICQAVHGWHGQQPESMNAINDQIQASIWEHLQRGTVAVHCLAGIHRAACIVACHFLYRYYILGHTDIPHNTTEIYRRLKAARPHVEPAYAHVLRNYENHLKSIAGSAAHKTESGYRRQ